MVVFQALAWDGRDDEETNQYIITIFGRAQDGKSVSVSTPFKPYFFCKMGPNQATAPSVPDSLKRTTQFKDLWGFQNGKKHKYAHYEFPTLASWRQGKSFTRRKGMQHYEANIDPVLRFMHRSGIKSTGWLDTGSKCYKDQRTHCDQCLYCAEWTDLKPVDRDDMAPLKVASLDIEAFSESGAFPDASQPNDACFQIAVSWEPLGQPQKRKSVCLCWPQTTKPRNSGRWELRAYETERDMLNAFGELVQKEDFDVLTGWNIFGFDFEFMATRAKMVGAWDFWRLSRLTTVEDSEKELLIKKLSSGALGDNVLKMLPMPGRFAFDLMGDVKREKKLESYSLNHVSSVYLGDQKIDMPVKEMFDAFRAADPRRLGKVAEYCAKDTQLPLDLMAKLATMYNLLEMAKATWVPINYLSERGQQIKVFSQLARKARELGYLIPTIYQDQMKVDEGKYQGATVLKACKGAYYTPITALDFASLYPSIMCAHNLCYSTMVMDPKYLGLPGVEYETLNGITWVQKDGGRDGLLPLVLAELKAFRKQAKKDMAKAKGTPMEAVYDGKQLAYKVSMNSMYGFTGVSKGMLPLKEIASTVTWRGRQMIEETKDYVETNFPGAVVRYGDSVVGDTPVVVRYMEGPSQVLTIEQLATEWAPMEGDKESCELHGWESWTDEGWTPIERVIRHKTDKEIFRVLAHGGVVDCTEDHSLLRPDGQPLKPHECEVGQEVMVKKLPCANWASVPVESMGLEDKVAAMKYWIAMENQGLTPFLESGRVRVSTGPDSPNGLVKKICSLGQTDDWVYDLTTGNHHFHAGVGGMIVHNTDSVMVQFAIPDGADPLESSWEQGERAAEECTKLFKAPNDLELEKVYYPFILYSKKRYAAKQWSKDYKSGKVTLDKVDIKGLQMVRRDNAPYTRNSCKDILNLILESKDPKPAIALARERAQELKEGKVDLDQLVLSRKLAGSYKSNALPHVTVVEKMRKRAPGSEPRSGDRVPFVICKGGRNDKMFEKAEDPTWVKEKGVPIDYQYYFTNQFQSPVSDLLEPLVHDTSTLFSQDTKRQVTLMRFMSK